MSRSDGPRIRAVILSHILSLEPSTHDLPKLHQDLQDEVSCATLPGFRFHIKTLSEEGFVRSDGKLIKLTSAGRLAAQYIQHGSLGASIFERRVREYFGRWGQKYGKIVTEAAEEMDREYAEKRQFLIRKSGPNKTMEPEQKATSAQVVKVAKSSRSNVEAAKKLGISESAFRERVKSIMTRGIKNASVNASGGLAK